MSDSETNNEFLGELLQAFSRHLVSISSVDVAGESTHESPKVARDSRAFAVSAFVVSVRDVWFLVTAGHILLQTRIGGAWTRTVRTPGLSR
jgi:hypothetical protein